MGQSLSYKNPPVIHYYKRFENSRNVCWPVYGYKIVAPKPVENRLNIFQKFLLRLSQAGYFETEVIANISGLNPKLICYIKEQLLSYGLISDDGLITESGAQELKDEFLFYSEPITGYIFQDPFSSSLFNQFSSSIHFADIEAKGKYQSRIYIDGENPKFTFWVGLDRLPDYHKPSTIEVLKAISNYSRLNKYLEDSDTFLLDSEEISLPKSFNRVSFISEVPELFYLLLQIKVTGNEQTDLEVINPFNFNLIDEKAKNLVCQRLKVDKNLQGYLSINASKELNEDIVIEQYRDFEEKTRLYMKELLTSMYGKQITRTKLFEKHLDYFIIEQQILKSLETESVFPLNKVKELSLKACILLSGFLKQLLLEADFASFINPDLFDENSRERYIKVALKKVGAKTEFSESLLCKSYSKKRFIKAIESVEEQNEKPLIPIFIFSLSTGIIESFLEVINADDSIINKMLDIVNIRNQKSSAHDTSEDPSSAELSIITSTIKILIDFYYNKYSQKVFHGQGQGQEQE